MPNKTYTTVTPRDPPMTLPTLSITIIPERDGTSAVLVSMRNADGTWGPVQKIPAGLDWRLDRFVADMQTLAQTKLAGSKPRPSRQRSPPRTLTANRSGNGRNIRVKVRGT